MRRSLLAANWKMNGTCAWTQDFLERFVDEVDPGGPEVLVCPPFTAVPTALLIATGSPVQVGAQNCHWAENGAFTGEVAAPMLAELGVRWVIVGHSERRQHFGESDETARDRAAAGQGAGLSVIFCLGETEAQREAGQTFDVLDRQVRVLTDLDPGRLVLAYEPVWAIGTGKNATAAQAQEAHAFLRARLRGMWDEATAESVRILYGGSMKPANAADLLSQKDVDGGLVGGASLDVESFLAIIRAASSAPLES